MKGRFQSALEVKLRDHADEKAASLAAGAAKDYAEYKYWVGYVQGLQACLELCAEIERDDSDERRSAA